MSKPTAREYLVTCNGATNPPSTLNDGKLIIEVRVLLDPRVEHHAFRLPIDLEALEKGELKSVPVEGLGS